MPIPSSGPVSFQDLKDEFRDPSNPVGMDEFYRGSLVPDSPLNNGSVPSSGTISLASMRGSSWEYVSEVTSPTTNLDITSLFSPAAWSSAAAKRVEIRSGVVIGATNTSTAAFTVPSSGAGDVRVNNAGSIQGAGGAAGSANGGAGSPGGPAFRANKAVTIQNTGQIYAGGGGGGAGGKGSNAGCGTYPSSSYTNCGSCAGGCPSTTNKSENPNGGICRVFPGPFFQYTCTIYCNGKPRPTSIGGNGGNGGRGRGYNQSAGGTNGGSGSSSCGGGGTGGTGGAGGGWGDSGNPGARGGNSGSNGGLGGSAGAYIVNNSNVNWVGPRGTVAGRVA